MQLMLDQPPKKRSIKWQLLEDCVHDRIFAFNALESSILSNEPTPRVQAVAAQLSDDLKPPAKISSLAHSSSGDRPEDTTLVNLYRHWNAAYKSSSYDILLDRIRNFEADPITWRSYYARAVVFLQSSGAGKSRLADKCGETIPAVTYVLRGRTSDGNYCYPPGDEGVFEFFNESPPERSPGQDSPATKTYTAVEPTRRTEII